MAGNGPAPGGRKSSPLRSVVGSGAIVSPRYLANRSLNAVGGTTAAWNLTFSDSDASALPTEINRIGPIRSDARRMRQAPTTLKFAGASQGVSVRFLKSIA
jgi:hypothetical protein